MVRGLRQRNAVPEQEHGELSFGAFSCIFDGISEIICKFAEFKKLPIMDKIRYINLCIVEFAKRFGMSAKIAFNYLHKYKGLDFLVKCYEAEHQLPLNDSIKDLVVICKRNGGTLG